MSSSRKFTRAVHKTAQDYYRFLTGDEELGEVVTAFSGGTGAHLGAAAFIWALAGWLYAIYVNAPLLPSLILGAMTGTLVGYLLAERAARRPAGPGAVHLVLLTTTLRVVTIRRYPTWRQKPLRSIPRENIESVEVTPLPIGMYRRVIINRTNQPPLHLVTSDEIGAATLSQTEPLPPKP